MDTPFIKRAYNLGLKAVPNFLTLSEEQIEYYEQHLDELPFAVSRGFTIPQNGVQKETVIPTESVLPAEEWTFDWWIAKAEEFSTKFLGVTIELRKQFDIPENLPFANTLPVFVPEDFTNRDVANVLKLKKLGLTVYEEVDVMKYSGSEGTKTPTLYLIENSVRPNSDTMNKSPNQLRKLKQNWLDLRGYTLAFALYHFATGKYLDPETFTWFPEDRLPSGHVAAGCWYPLNRRLRFDWSRADYSNSGGGARLAVPVSLKP